MYERKLFQKLATARDVVIKDEHNFEPDFRDRSSTVSYCSMINIINGSKVCYEQRHVTPALPFLAATCPSSKGWRTKSGIFMTACAVYIT